VKVVIVSESVFIEKDNDVERLDLIREGIKKIEILAIGRKAIAKQICTIDVKLPMPYIQFICKRAYIKIDATTLKIWLNL